MPLSQVRAAKNEALFRSVNDRILELGESFPKGDLIEIVCECSDQNCLVKLEATAEEYRSVRADPTWFIAVAGHVDPAIERVVEDRGRYLVVEKLGIAGAVAADLSDG